MKYVIFDLEWNQPADENGAVQDPVYLSGEIIEIGAVKLDENFCPEDELRLFIAPKYYTKMHRQIASLTGIRDKDLSERGIPFPEAYRKFTVWCGEEYAYMTWSMSDMPMLIDNMILHGIDISDLPVCYDIQRIFSREIMRTDTRYSLDSALSLMKEKGDTAHDALNDARNTAKICGHLELDQYLDEYTLKMYAQIPAITRYETRRQIFEETSLLEFDCPWCRGHVKCESWISAGHNTYFAYGICPEEDEFLAQLSVVAHQRGVYSVRRVFFDMSDDLWDTYMDKKEALGI